MSEPIELHPLSAEELERASEGGRRERMARAIEASNALEPKLPSDPSAQAEIAALMRGPDAPKLDPLPMAPEAMTTLAEVLKPASTNAMGIGTVLVLMHAGHRVRRAGWNGKGMWLALQVPDAMSKMTLPYVYMRTAQGDLVPWLCSQTDLLAANWELADD